MHTARTVMESARVSQVEMQFSQCVSSTSWAGVSSLRVESSSPQLKQVIIIIRAGKTPPPQVEG